MRLAEKKLPKIDLKTSPYILNIGSTPETARQVRSSIRCVSDFLLPGSSFFEE
jgi:hypothetical protein